MRIRKDDGSKVIFAITLAELLFTFLFITLAAIGIMKAHSDKDVSSVKVALENCRNTNKQEEIIKSLERKNRELEATNGRLQKQVAILVNSLVDNKRTLGAKIVLSQQVEDILKAQTMGADAGKAGGVGKPFCSLYNGALFVVTLHEDKSMTVNCEWDADKETKVMGVAGIRNARAALNGKRVSLNEFDRAYNDTQKYCEANNCLFRVKAYDTTETKDSYKHLISFLEARFYVAKR